LLARRGGGKNIAMSKGFRVAVEARA